MNLHFLLPIIAACFLVGCTTTSSTTWGVGTGKYPNSKYTFSAPADGKTTELQSAVFGATQSKVNIKLFTDYQCPACQSFHTRIEDKLWKDYIDTKKISVTFLNYPLTMAHKNAEGDALAALCALSQGKFREYRNTLYKIEETKKGAAMTDAERTDIAKAVGITDASFEQCVSNAWYQKTLDAEVAEGNRLGLQGTPSVFLNDRPMNYQTEEQFFGIIEAMLKQGN